MDYHLWQLALWSILDLFITETVFQTCFSWGACESVRSLWAGMHAQCNASLTQLGGGGGERDSTMVLSGLCSRYSIHSPESSVFPRCHCLPCVLVFSRNVLWSLVADRDGVSGYTYAPGLNLLLPSTHDRNILNSWAEVANPFCIVSSNSAGSDVLGSSWRTHERWLLVDTEVKEVLGHTVPIHACTVACVLWRTGQLHGPVNKENC